MPYICDAEKNDRCDKVGCGATCRLTNDKRFAKTGEAPTPLLNEVRKDVERKTNTRKAGATEKGIYQDPPILSDEGMAQEAEMDSPS